VDRKVTKDFSAKENSIAILFQKIAGEGQTWWLMSVIPATQEAEVEMIVVRD
jgi:hypothetical protein